jgi:2-polyprenyl-3-methyl-5-hydroxy-6-metoxy-1,4-benzoquinol methylase
MMATFEPLAPTREQYIAELLRPYQPQVPLPVLVEQVNKIYHSIEAHDYDRLHPELLSALPGCWHEMLSRLPEKKDWRILDFGCGTGFEASLVLAQLGDRVQSLTCYDLSPEMLGLCKSRLGNRPQVLFTSTAAEIAAHGLYDILLTNSLLHHLPDVNSTIQTLLGSLAPDAFWLAGHEPSARFYSNPQCVSLLKRYMRHQRWARFADPRSYFRKLKQLVQIEPDPLHATSVAAHEQGLFAKLPSRVAIDRVVDFSVPHSTEEAAAGRGFDVVELKNTWKADWSLDWTKTYSFMGPVKEVSVSARWQRPAQQLARLFPDDGANVCCMWKRCNTSCQERHNGAKSASRKLNENENRKSTVPIDVSVCAVSGFPGACHLHWSVLGDMADAD